MNHNAWWQARYQLVLVLVPYLLLAYPNGSIAQTTTTSTANLAEDKVATAIKDVLGRYRQAFESCNWASIDGVLDNTYKILVLAPPGEGTSFATKDDLLSYTSVSQTHCPTLKRSMKLHSVSVGQLDEHTVVATALIERRSIYFTAKSLDVFRFHKIGDDYRLMSVVITAMKATDRSSDTATLLVVPEAAYIAASKTVKRFSPEDADIWLATLPRSTTSLPVGAAPRAVIAVPRQPVFPGDKIQINHHYFYAVGLPSSQFSQTATAKKVHLQFIFSTNTRITSPGSVRYEVRRNGKSIGTLAVSGR